jgi:hypothetical protein
MVNENAYCYIEDRIGRFDQVRPKLQEWMIRAHLQKLQDSVSEKTLTQF